MFSPWSKRVVQGAYDMELGGVGFIAVEPRDMVLFRRGGVALWGRWRPDGVEVLSCHEAQILSAAAPCRPPGADVLLVSPPITDGRRRREVLKAVEAALWCTPRVAAA